MERSARPSARLESLACAIGFVNYPTTITHHEPSIPLSTHYAPQHGDIIGDIIGDTNGDTNGEPAEVDINATRATIATGIMSPTVYAPCVRVLAGTLYAPRCRPSYSTILRHH